MSSSRSISVATCLVHSSHARRVLHRHGKRWYHASFLSDRGQLSLPRHRSKAAGGGLRGPPPTQGEPLEYPSARVHSRLVQPTLDRTSRGDGVESCFREENTHWPHRGQIPRSSSALAPAGPRRYPQLLFPHYCRDRDQLPRHAC